MKPKLFIGSSTEGLDIAYAIQSQLTNDAECTVWKNAFPLGSYTLSSIIKSAYSSDFGVFVFSPDDISEMRKERFSVARDNVLYELGLFTGQIGSDRCFFVLPDSMPTLPLHRPSDLQGITSGSYEANRSDKDWKSAVGSFCHDVRTLIRQRGLAEEPVHEELRDLAIRFDCCDWIEDSSRRVKQKQDIIDQMISFCKKNTDTVNKRRLSARKKTGWNVLLCAAIQAQPSDSDADLLLALQPAGFTQGVAQATVISTIDMLHNQKKISKPQEFVTWLKKLRTQLPDHLKRIDDLVGRFH